MRGEAQGGAQSPFAAFPLWERTPGAARRWDNAPVIAAMLNGAQGDDDESLAGHFALVTGRVGAAGDGAGAGAMGDWLANNFYTLDNESEKGILAAMLPLDNYLADLNSGQAWYRPSYLLVAVLASERVPNFVQSALARTYNQFYRHQLVYDHATMNCTSICVDVLRTLGWKVPSRGATSWVGGGPGAALRCRARAQPRPGGGQRFDYLTEDQTRLFPAAAFEEIGADLLRLATRRPARAPTAFEAMLVEDLDALIFVRVPQLPSSRVWGDYPVAGAWEYRARLPRDPGEAKIIPVPPRPFPGAPARPRPAAAAGAPLRDRDRAVGGVVDRRHSLAAVAGLAGAASSAPLAANRSVKFSNSARRVKRSWSCFLRPSPCGLSFPRTAARCRTSLLGTADEHLDENAGPRLCAKAACIAGRAERVESLRRPGFEARIAATPPGPGIAPVPARRAREPRSRRAHSLACTAPNSQQPMGRDGRSRSPVLANRVPTAIADRARTAGRSGNRNSTISDSSRSTAMATTSSSAANGRCPPFTSEPSAVAGGRVPCRSRHPYRVPGDHDSRR